MAITIRTPELPIEILHLIIEQLPPKSLKNVRLSSKTLAMLAEPLLFHRMTLVPYTDCLQPFANLMRDNPLAAHVKIICYNAQFRRCSELIASMRPHPPQNVKDTLLANAFETEEDDTMETMFLAECLRQLPMLKEVVVADIPFCDWSSKKELTCLDDPPSYFHRTFKGTTVPTFSISEHEIIGSPYPACPVVLLASFFAGVKLNRFQATGLSTGDFLEPYGMHPRSKELGFFASAFAELKELDVSFSSSTDRCHESANTNIGPLVKAAKDLKQLRLRGCNARVDIMTTFQPRHSWLSNLVRHSDGKIQSKPSLPHLTHLTLDSVACQEVELLALIQMHRHTLKRVELRKITLIKDLEQDSPPCWVRVLKKLRSCRIPMSFDGDFTNLRRQWWRFSAETPALRKTSLKAQVETWVSGHGSSECPIEKAAVKLDADKKEILTQAKDFFYGDSSLIMHRQYHKSLVDDISDDDGEDDDFESDWGDDEYLGYFDNDSLSGEEYAGDLDDYEDYEDYWLPSFTGSLFSY
jgi:hypothetical protein